MVDAVTNLYTLVTEFGLTQRAAGTGSVVFTTGRWSTDIAKLKNAAGAKKTLNLMIKLAGFKLAEPISQGWIKFPLGNSGGVLELRTEGMRSYGKIVGRDQMGRALVVFESAEDKDFEDKADQDLIARARTVADAAAKRWKELEPNPDAEPQVPKVANLADRRAGRLRMKKE